MLIVAAPRVVREKRADRARIILHNIYYYFDPLLGRACLDTKENGTGSPSF